MVGSIRSGHCSYLSITPTDHLLPSMAQNPPPTYFNNIPSLHESMAGVPAVLGNLDLNRGIQAGAAIDRDNLLQAKCVAKSLRTMHGNFFSRLFECFC